MPRLGELPSVDAERFEASLAKMAADALASGSPERNPVDPRGGDHRALQRRVVMAGPGTGP